HENAVGEVDATAGDGRARVAGANWRSPEHLRAAGRELVEHAVFAPDAVPLRAEPLRPVVRPGHCGKALTEANRERQAKKRIWQGHPTDLRTWWVYGGRGGMPL